MASLQIIESSRAIAEKGWKIAFAESATAGRLASEFSLTPYSGQVLLGGIVCYDAAVKKMLLKVPPQVIEEHTCESAEVTRLLADNLKTLFQAEVYVAVTGLNAPGGSETESKPVGTMFFHINFPNKYVQHREVFEGGPEEIVRLAILRIAELLLDNLN